MSQVEVRRMEQTLLESLQEAEAACAVLQDALSNVRTRQIADQQLYESPLLYPMTLLYTLDSHLGELVTKAKADAAHVTVTNWLVAAEKKEHDA